MSDIQEEQKRLYKRAEKNDIKFRVIDLLNKIANKEKIPKKIRIRGIYYRDYDEETEEMIDKEDMTIWELDNSYAYGDYYNKDGKQLFSDCFIVNRILEDKIEILKGDNK